MSDTRSALDAALRLLALRPRAERELRQRLARRGFESEEIEGALRRLTELRLVDDAAFARFWVEQRDAFRPSGRRRLEAELRGKGVAREAVVEAVRGNDDAVSIEDVARQRAAALADLDDATFSRRLLGFLARRGYGSSLAREVAERLRRERFGRA